MTQQIDGSSVVQLDTIEVVGRRGSTDIEPENELNTVEIDQLGAYDIGEVVTRANAISGARDTPTILINGRPTANADSIMGFPPGALERVEVLPLDAGALYGFDPSRRVINLVVRNNFISRDARVSAAQPHAGGKSTLSIDLRSSEISEGSPRQIGLTSSRDTALTADEREGYRKGAFSRDEVTLRPHSDVLSANLAFTEEVGGWAGSFAANARVQNEHSVAQFGTEVVKNKRSTQSLALSSGLTGKIMDWSLRLGWDGQIFNSDQTGLNDLTSATRSTALRVGADHRFIGLQSGPVVTNLAGLATYTRAVTRNELGENAISSSMGEAKASVRVPLLGDQPASDRNLHLGKAALTLSGAVRGANSSPGSSLTSSLSWSPFRYLRLDGSWSTSTESPSPQQRFDPIRYGVSRVVFDFLNEVSAEVLPIVGGNPDLKSPTTEQAALTIGLGPATPLGFAGAVAYQRIDTLNRLDGLPIPTLAIEAAFPDRFQRNAEGELVVIDVRPINLKSATAESLTTNLTFDVPLPEWSSMRMGGLEVVQVAINHRWQLANATTIRDGLPVMDRLAGDLGGLSPHDWLIQLDGRGKSWGINATIRQQGGYRIRREIGRDEAGDLRIAPISIFDIDFTYFFARDVSADPGGSPKIEDTQLKFEIENLLDVRPKATLGDGSSAPGYGRDDQDPVGRTIRLSLSRRF